MKMSVTLLDEKLVKFLLIDINIKDNKTTINKHEVQLNSSDLEKVKETHRIIIPAKIDIKSGIANIAVPTFWNIETMENYIQTLMDSLLLYKEEPESIEQLINEYSLEMLVFE